MKIRNIILTLAIMLTVIIFGAGKIEAKEKTIGNFKYSYQNYSGGIHISEIEPLSEKGIGTLKIPSVIDGKKHMVLY